MVVYFGSGVFEWWVGFCVVKCVGLVVVGYSSRVIGMRCVDGDVSCEVYEW